MDRSTTYDAIAVFLINTRLTILFAIASVTKLWNKFSLDSDKIQLHFGTLFGTRERDEDKKSTLLHITSYLAHIELVDKPPKIRSERLYCHPATVIYVPSR